MFKSVVLLFKSVGYLKPLREKYGQDGNHGLCFRFLNIFLTIMIYTGLLILCFCYFHLSQSQVLSKKPLEIYKIKENLHFLAEKNFKVPCCTSKASFSKYLIRHL